MKPAQKKIIKIRLVPLFSKLLLLPFTLGFLSLGSLNPVGSASDSDTVQVSVQIESTIALSSPTDLTLLDGAGNIIGSGDTDGDDYVTWNVTTNSTTGYTVTWLAEETGANTAGAMESTGADLIAAYTPAVSGTPETWSVANTDSEWGGRVSSTSECTRSIDFGTDTSSETWLNVNHSTATQICSSASESGSGGDDIPVHFRVEVGANKNQPTGTYTVNVTLTATTQ